MRVSANVTMAAGAPGREPARAARALGRPRLAVVAPGPGLVGGQETQASALCLLMNGEGWQVDRLAVNPAIPAALAWARRLPGLRTAVSEALYLPSLLRLRRGDVVHVFSASYWSFLLGPVPALLAARLMGARAILHYHSGEAGDHLGRWGVLVHPWMRLADAIVVPSEFLRALFARHGHAARVIPNVVDLSRFAFRGRHPLRPRFLSARSLEPHYGVESTLRAFALVRRAHPDATLAIAGTGSEEPRLKALARDLGWQGIRFLGAVDPRHMPLIYDGCDIFLNSSLIDNQPVSVLEAFAAGLPVVSTACGDLSRLVRNDRTGLIVPAADPAAMAAAACALLASPERAVRIAGEARREADNHSWERIRERWLEVYDEVRS